MGGYKRIMYKMYKFLTEGEGGGQKKCVDIYMDHFLVDHQK